ncbi:preprotein translocase subunit SecE [Crenobacter cavernae]|uniref:Protein translocase subunit SecE n=1 Tax=Crenobacter cavernae TaxID=2290923 RepID=A0A345Y3T1_9NEIS|nr:preprotein translocase subunit SecE [Crenobacter cavernae]AXK38583.1 preprotein translocase subunit SecE [Crenobacter cavernae]RXZ44613.1 preprotein translocase subunit SecE [Crenobacter cavernae]
MEMQDKLKLAFAALLLVGGIVGFYLVPESQGLLRALAFVAGLVLAGGVLWVSAPGKAFASYAQDSVGEARKVVWPERKEALQLTGLVFLFVLVLALFMWSVDSGLSWLFYDLLLGRG